MAKEQWREELDTYRSIQKMFILEGNIADIQLVQSGMNAGDLVSLEEYLHLYLKGKGYRSVVFYNRMDGFYNYYDDEGIMVQRFLEQGQMSAADRMDIQTAMTGIRKAVNGTDHSVAVIVQMAGQLMSSADHLSDSEIEYMSTLMLAAGEAVSGMADNEAGWANNLIFLITNKAQELPAWFYRYSPHCRVLTLEKPREEMRERLIRDHAQEFAGWTSMDVTVRDKLVKQMVAQSDGFACAELSSVLELCRGRSFADALDRIHAYRHGRKENPWSTLSPQQVCGLEDELSQDVIGQAKAVHAVADIVMRATTGIGGLQHSSQHRPKGVLFFAGPTGTGKTELAKSLARNIFGAESALIRFDMSEYSQPHSDQRLLGAPPGYIGYDAGGELTNAVRQHPFSILLFDEIEKANATILDKFLQILDDGRMTDSKGETVYFSECIIIFTSNMGMARTLADGSRESLCSMDDSLDVLEAKVKNELRRCWRPEFLNRIGSNIIVFDYIREEMAEKIMLKQLHSIMKSLEEQRHIQIRIPPEGKYYRKLLSRCLGNLEYGGRGIGNMVESDFSTPLARELVYRRILPGDQVVLDDMQRTETGVELTWQTVR